MCTPLGMLFIMKTLGDEQYIAIWWLISIVKVSQMTKMFFLHFFFFFFFRWASSNLCDSFMMFFAQNCSTLYWAVHQPIIFTQLWSLTGHFKIVWHSLWFSQKTAAIYTEQCTNPSLFCKFVVSWVALKKYSFICNAILFSSTCMFTNHLATKRDYYSRLLN